MSTPEINRIRERLRLLDQARVTEAARPTLSTSLWRDVDNLPWRTALGAAVLGLLILLAAGVFTARPSAITVSAEAGSQQAAIETALAQLRPDARDLAFAEVTAGASR